MSTSTDQAPAGVTNGQNSMTYFVQHAEFVKNDDVAFADKAVAPRDCDESISRVDDAITPLRRGRLIASVTRTVTAATQPGGTTTVAGVDRTMKF